MNFVFPKQTNFMSILRQATFSSKMIQLRPFFPESCNTSAKYQKRVCWVDWNYLISYCGKLIEKKTLLSIEQDPLKNEFSFYIPYASQ